MSNFKPTTTMSYNSGRQSRKNKFSQVNMHRHTSVVEYLEKIYEWRSWPGVIRDGKLFVIFHGHEIPNDEFLELQPQPIVMDFNSDLTGIDGTKNFMQP